VSDLAFIPPPPETAVPEPQRPKVRRQIVAAALSALLPGAGQLFRGHKKKALFLFVGLTAIWFGFWILRLPTSYPGLMFLIWMCLLLSLFAVFDALLSKDAGSSARVSRWWIFVGIPLHYLGTNLVFTLLLLGSGFQTFRFVSSSMEPTILPGDKFVADKRYYQLHPSHRGDLALLRYSKDVTVKRIIAIDGDTIEGKRQKIFLNGEPLYEPFVRHEFREGLDPELDTFGPVKIPPGKYFVMGDNRDVSLDSRSTEIGLLDVTAIVGRPLYGYHIVDKPHYWELQ
jgi:signal peptidase I